MRIGDIFWASLAMQALPNSSHATGNQARRSLVLLCQANRLQRLAAFPSSAASICVLVTVGAQYLSMYSITNSTPAQ
jgi:hypothetical protein